LPPKARRQNFQTISWFWDLHNRELLDLDPPYQRRSVWNQSYKDSFIDTILMQYPAPAIFLYEEVSDDGTSKYHVVDGKQRLMSVFDFAKGEFPVSEDSIVTHLRGRKLSQFSADDRTAFGTYQFSVEYLPTNEESVINGIFERINKNTAKLTRQELRHARLSGLFITAAENAAESMFKKLPEGFPRLESQSKKQMKDVELVANLLLSFESGVRGYSQDELDEAFSDRDVEWEKRDEAETWFSETLECLSAFVKLPRDNPLLKSRMRNQADFYSLFTAVGQMAEERPHLCSDDVFATRLADFLSVVEDEQRRQSSKRALEYFTAARSNSNDTGPRKLRTETLINVLRGRPEAQAAQ
jgi:hypothetical protein